MEDDADLHFIEGCSAPKYNVANLHAGAVELFIGKGEITIAVILSVIGIISIPLCSLRPRKPG